MDCCRSARNDADGAAPSLLSSSAQAEDPVRRGFSAQSSTSLGYWVARVAIAHWRDDIGIWFRVLAARCARALHGTSRPRNQRAQGMPDARCTRGLMRNVHRKCAHEHTGQRRAIRHSLRNGFTAYNVISPVSRVLLPPDRRQHRGVRTTRLCRTLQLRVVSRSLSVHRYPPLVRDDGQRPSGRDGMRVI